MKNLFIGWAILVAMFVGMMCANVILDFVRRLPDALKLAVRWCTNSEMRKDLNYLIWNVRSKDIKGSRCSLCMGWQEGNPGDHCDPPDQRWVLCDKCAGIKHMAIECAQAVSNQGRI